MNFDKSQGPFPGKFIFPFFLFHMLMFGGSGFLMAYSSDKPDLGFLYMHGGIAIVVYLVFYLVIFGPGKVGWMFIIAALGLFGIVAQIDFILALFGKRFDDFPLSVHVVPFIYYVLYTFLLYQAVLWITGANRTPSRRRWVESAYVVVSVVFYGSLLFLSYGEK